MSELAVRPHQVAHLVTARGGTHEVGQVVYSTDLHSGAGGFSPAKVGAFAITGLEVTRDDVLIHTAGGTIRLAASGTHYSYRVAP